MKFHVAIPSRFGSSRLPGKPLVDLAGKPMVRHVFERAQESGVGDIVIATDDDRVREAAESFGATVCMTAATHRSGSDRLAEVAERLGWADDDIVVNLQGDEPLTPGRIVRQVADDLAEHPDASIATLCTPIQSATQLFDPHVVKVVRDSEHYALYFSRAAIPWERDAFDVETHPEVKACFRHIGLYAYRVGFLRRFATMEPCTVELLEQLEQLRALYHGERIYVGEAVEAPGHGVDTPEDARTVEALLRAR
ncbi:MAG TPA: 3-deoxy-manno-octulosonate cytidylyltransferase [Thioalkalivibrio sp.]|nr:3-deoxy-manno-octulosonate cytidylyltransferase [Thioalkalivibrio sp.]